MLVRIDFSDWERLAEEYNERIRNLSQHPFGDFLSRLSNFPREALRTALLEDSERVTQTTMNEDYRETDQGHYGSGWTTFGNDQSKINPQEFIDPSTEPVSKVDSSGHIYADSYVQTEVTGGRILWGLYTNAEMRPYAKYSRKEGGRWVSTYLLPKMPIMHYMRRGWQNPMNPYHRMNPRPFTQYVARRGRNMLSFYNFKLLENAGFRRGQ